MLSRLRQCPQQAAGFVRDKMKTVAIMGAVLLAASASEIQAAEPMAFVCSFTYQIPTGPEWGLWFWTMTALRPGPGVPFPTSGTEPRCGDAGRRMVAKLDRLSRNVHFITGLQKSGCHSSVPTRPRWTSSRLTSSAIAQRERKLISTRTREGLVALKQRGVTKKDNPVRLDNPKNGTEEQTAKANVGAKRKADASAGTVIREIRKWQAKGITTYKDLADMLTGKIKAPRGADRWQATQVKRILERVRS